MGLFDGFFGSKNNEKNTTASTTSAVPAGALLNLKKTEILDLTKEFPTLDNMVFAAGWDINERGTGNYDLDLCALLLNDKDRLISRGTSLIYYGRMKGQGIYLNGDNLTGEGDGDDESIFVKLSELPKECSKIVFSVVIYNAKSRGQAFKHVKNAYVRLLDADKGELEVCRYNLTEDGGNDTAIIVAELYKVGSEWNFKAVGEYKKASIEDIESLYK